MLKLTIINQNCDTEIQDLKNKIDNVCKSKNINLPYDIFDKISDENLQIAKASKALIILDKNSLYNLTNISENLNLYSHISFCQNDFNFYTFTSNIDNFHKHGFSQNNSFGREAYDTISISELEIERVCRHAFEIAENNKQNLCLVDNAIFLNTDKLWRKIATDINEDYPSVILETLSLNEFIKKDKFGLLNKTNFICPKEYRNMVISQLNCDFSSKCDMIFGNDTFAVYKPNLQGNSIEILLKQMLLYSCGIE